MNDALPPSAPEADPTPPTAPPARRWSFAKRFAFRFALIYVILYTHPFPLTLLSNPRSVAQVFDAEWAVLDASDPVFKALGTYRGWVRTAEYAGVDFLAEHVFRVTEPLDRPRGSGDTTHSYIRLVLLGWLALVLATLWSWLMRRSRGHPFLAGWFHVGTRYFLASVMFSYGFVKVFPLQFRWPSLARLLAPYGDSSPMNVLWTFMGSSEAYIIFSGVAEVVGGLLLLFRRTATLGALVVVGVMVNVAALNYCYDVPVKLYSSHLGLFAMGLLLPDVRRLVRVFVLNRPTEPRSLRRPHLPVIGHVMRFVVVVPLLIVAIGMGYKRSKPRDLPALYGIWDVEQYVLDDQVVPPLLTDGVRWQNLVIERKTSAVVRGMDGTQWRHGLVIDDDSLRLSASSVWTYDVDGDSLVLHGEFQRFYRRDMTKMVGSKNPSIPRAPQVVVRMKRRAGTPDAPADPSLERPPSDRKTMIGTWDVVDFQVIGETFLPRRRSDPARWTSLEIEGWRDANVTFEGGRTDEYDIRVKEEQKTLRFSYRAELAYEVDGDRLTLTGPLRGHQLRVELRRRDLKTFLLERRGFNWINEIPLNRY